MVKGHRGFRQATVHQAPVEPAVVGVTDYRRQHPRGVTGLDPRRNARAGGSQVELLRLFVLIALRTRLRRKAGVVARSPAPLPAGCHDLGQSQHFLPFHIAGKGQGHVARYVATGVVIAHKLGRHLAYALGRAQHRLGQRVNSKITPLQTLEEDRVGAVAVEGYFLQDDLALAFEVGGADRWLHQIGQQIQQARHELGQHRPVENGHFFVGESVVLGSHPVELAVDLSGAASFGAFEHHVLEEVTHAFLPRQLVPAAGVHEVTNRRRLGSGDYLGYHP